MTNLIRSMTGFGSAATEFQDLKLGIEIKSLNNRFVDINLRLPPVYSGLEFEFRKVITKQVVRGRVEVTIKCEKIAAGKSCGQYCEVDQQNLDRMFSMFQTALDSVRKYEMSEQIKEFFVKDLLLHNKIFCADSERGVIGEIGCESGGISESEKQALLDLINQALQNFENSRIAEGAVIALELSQRVAEISSLREKIVKLANASLQSRQLSIQDKIQEIGQSLAADPQRLAQEFVFWAEKLDISEELSRLQCHLELFKLILSQEASGKKLEFVLQEISRELNTISSKAQNPEIQSLVVSAKVESEKIREQLQNII